MYLLMNKWAVFHLVDILFSKIVESDLGSEKPDLETERSDLGAERPDLGSERPEMRSERPDLGSKGLHFEALGEGGWTENGNWKICPVWNHRSSAPPGPLPKKAY